MPGFSNLDNTYRVRGYRLGEAEDDDRMKLNYQEAQSYYKMGAGDRRQEPQDGGADQGLMVASEFIPKGGTAAGTGPAAAGGEAGAGGTAGLGEVTAGSSSGTSSAGGMSGMGIGAIIAAAIAMQMVASHNTDREFEGVETKDVTSGRPFTEPWQAWVSTQLEDEEGGSEYVTSGEGLDAAIRNKDWGLMARRSPHIVSHDPLGELSYLGTKKYGGKTVAGLIDPMTWAKRKYLYKLG